MTSDKRDQAIAKITENISRFGYHVYLIVGDQCPRYLYTIGLSDRIGAELLLAGGAEFSGTQAKQIVDTCASLTNSKGHTATMKIVGLGEFSLRPVHESWRAGFIFGAFDYYGHDQVSALQIVPERARWTIDVPDLSRGRSDELEPVWQWLGQPWPYSISRRARVITEIRALRGERVTGAVRTSEGEWEMSVGDGSEVSPDDIRRVPFGTLLAVDPTLSVAMDLEVGAGIQRLRADLEWQVWN